MTIFIDTPLSKFALRDDRGSDPQSVASVWPADDQEKWNGNEAVVINGRTYGGPFYLRRHTYRNDDHEFKIITGPGWGAQLTEAARRKLETILDEVWAMFPPLTHAEKVERMIDSVRSGTRSRLDHEVEPVARKILDEYNMGQSDSYRHNADERDPVTDAELAKINRAVLDEVAKWLKIKRQELKGS